MYHVCDECFVYSSVSRQGEWIIFTGKCFGCSEQTANIQTSPNCVTQIYHVDWVNHHCREPCWVFCLDSSHCSLNIWPHNSNRCTNSICSCNTKHSISRRYDALYPTPLLTKVNRFTSRCVWTEQLSLLGILKFFHTFQLCLSLCVLLLFWGLQKV